MDHKSKTTHECETPVVQKGTVETQDRGLFDFMGKKGEEGEKKQEEVMVAVMAEEFILPCSKGAAQSPARKKEGETKQEEVEEEFILPSSVGAAQSPARKKEGETKQEEVMVAVMAEEFILASSVGAAQSPARKKEEEGETKQEEVMVEKFILPSSVSAQSLAQNKKDDEGIPSSIGAAQSPAPATSSDVMAIDQGVAYLLMLVALVVTYIIH